MKKRNLIIIFLMFFLVSFCLLNSITLENMNDKRSIINKSQNDNEDYFNHDS